MRLSAAGSGGRSSRCDQDLHREELGEDEMFASRVKISLACRKMDLMQRGDSFPEIDSMRQKRLDRASVKTFECPVNQSAKRPLRKPLGRRINWSDAAEVHRDLIIVLDDFKLRMLHAEPPATQSR